jgi:hypothetical protein
MPTHAELAGRLLVDAAGFFRTLAEQNEPIRKEMDENAGVFEQMAKLLAQDPSGKTNESAYSELAAKLLRDAAGFFRTLAEQNEPLKEQMDENASVFEHIATLVAQNPLGNLD